MTRPDAPRARSEPEASEVRFWRAALRTGTPIREVVRAAEEAARDAT